VFLSLPPRPETPRPSTEAAARATRARKVAAGGDLHTRTHLHVDDGPAVNFLAQGEAASWTAIHPKDWDQVKLYLQEKLAGTYPDAANFGVDFLLTRDQWLDDDDVRKLQQAGVVIWQFEQKQGEVVILPAHVPHQVLHRRVSARLRSNTSRCDGCNTLCPPHDWCYMRGWLS
jgi:hypothetical protein